MSERSIFLAALDIADPAKQTAYLDQACGNDAALRKHIEELIAAEPQLGDFLAEPHVASEVTVDLAPLTERPGALIGPYKLLQQIGEGGFGVVYMAEQLRPVRRKVALKIIKPGMDTREVIARFESERQALALMDHPNIARVLDGGTTESGRPYFVMELVKGVPLTEFCDDNQLDMRQRLTLFSAVCKAIQHAHHKGVIHRDIKPSNVMVTLHDGQPVPKVIDFGVSKAIAQQLTEKTLFTAYGQMIGTPAYMSPEQAEMSGLDIDTRSDVYSLGVLLYELLTGGTPLEAQSLRGKAYAELQRMIREDEPPRPSLRVSTQGEATALIASRRGTGPRELGALLRGELDWIVMKALEKNRDRRYESANSFADDVQRYLRHEAVEACPPSALYRTRKFMRRHRVACTTGTFVALSLLGGISISLLAAREALYQRRLAEESLRVAFADRQAAEQAQKSTVVALQTAERERERAESAQAEESKQLQVAKAREAEAKTARQEEFAQRTAVEQQRDKANALNTELAKQKEQQRRMLYVAQINLIQKAWDTDNIVRVRELLNATRPRPGEDDLRGFEWHYWQRMLHGEERVLQLPIGSGLSSGESGRKAPGSAGQIVALALSHDGNCVAAITGFASQVVKVWETSSGRQMFERVFVRHVVAPSRPAGPSQPNPFIDICYVDSERIAVVTTELETSVEGTTPPKGTSRLRVLRFDTGEETLSKETRQFVVGVESFAFSRDGSRVAAAMAEPLVQIWDSHSGMEVARVVIPSKTGVNRITEFLALSPDGTRLAVKPSVPLSSGTEPFGITIVEVGTGKTVTTPPVFAQQLEFSPDGMRVVARDSNASNRPETRVTVFDATSGERLYSLETITSALSALSSYPRSGSQRFSPDGKWLAFTSDTGTSKLQFWNAATGEAGPEFKGHSSTPLRVAFSADGKRLLSAHENGSIIFWPLPPPATPQPDRVAVNVRSRSRPFGESPDGRWIASAPLEPTASPSGVNPTPSDAREPIPTELTIQDTSGKVADRIFPLTGRLVFAKFSFNGAYLAAGSVDEQRDLDEAGELKVWELSTGRVLISIRTQAIVLRRQPPARGLPSSPGTAARVDGGVSGRSLATSERNIAFSLDNERLAIPVRAGIENGRPKLLIHVWDLASGRELLAGDQLPVMRLINNRLEFNGSGDLLISAPRTNPSQVATQNRQRAARGTMWGGTGGTSDLSGVQVWDATSGRLLWEEPRPVAVVANPDGSCLAGIVNNPSMGGEQSQTLVVWNARTGKEIYRLPLPVNQPVTGIAVNPDGSRLALVSGKDVAVYDAVRGTELFALQGHGGSIRAVAFSSDGQRIATSAGSVTPTIIYQSTDESRETKVWDAVTGQELLALKGARRASTYGFLFIGAALELTPHALRATPGQTWDAAPLAAETEAEELVRWLATAPIGGRLPTRAELMARIDMDRSIGEPARAVALRRVRDGARDADRLLRASWELVKHPAQPAESYQRAFDLVVEVCEADPNLQAALYTRGAAQYRLGRYVEALVDLERALQGQEAAQLPAIPVNLILLALTQHQLGRADQARDYLSQFDRFMSQLDGGNVYTDVSAVPFAFATPAHTQILRNEATALLGVAEDRISPSKEGRDVELADANENVRLDPSSAEAYNWRGFAHLRNEDYDQAIRDWTEASRLRPTSAGYRYNRANAWKKKGELDNAINDYDEAIRLDPKYALAYNDRGNVWLQKGELDRAIRDYDASIRLDPKFAAAYSNRAHVWKKKGELDKAIQDYGEAIRRDAVPPTLEARAWFQATCPDKKYRDGKQAVADATQACELTSWKIARYVDTLAAAHAETGNWEEAVKWQEKAITLATASFKADFESRLALYREGKPYRDTVSAKPAAD